MPSFYPQTLPIKQDFSEHQTRIQTPRTRHFTDRRDQELPSIMNNRRSYQSCDIGQLAELDLLINKRRADLASQGFNPYKSTVGWENYTKDFQAKHGFAPNRQYMTKFASRLEKDPTFYMGRDSDKRIYPELQDIGNIYWKPTDKEMAAVAPRWLDKHRLEARKEMRRFQNP